MASHHVHFQKNITCGQEITVLRRLRCNPSPRLLLSMVHQERVGTTYNGVKFICEASLSAVPSGETLVNNEPITLPWAGPSLLWAPAVSAVCTGILEPVEVRLRGFLELRRP